MRLRLPPSPLLFVLLAGCGAPASGSDTTHAAGDGDLAGWRRTFAVEKTNLRSSGTSTYFDLTPGARSVFEHGKTRLTITVLDETRVVDQVETRIVEEREEVEGKPREVSRNFFAIDATNGDVYYFGEEVDIYKHGEILDHTGGWVAGVSGAHFGLALPAQPRLGDKYFQECAPGVAMDRGEVVGLTDRMPTPAGTFEPCVHVRETTPLEHDVGDKWYAANVGLVRDDDLLLVSHTTPAPTPAPNPAPNPAPPPAH